MSDFKYITYNTGDKIWFYVNANTNEMVVVKIETHDGIIWNWGRRSINISS